MSDKYKAQGAKKLSQVPLGMPAKKLQQKQLRKIQLTTQKK